MILTIEIRLIVVSIALILGPAFRSKRWTDGAHKMARQYDIELPKDVDVRVARLLNTGFVRSRSGRRDSALTAACPVGMELGRPIAGRPEISLVEV
jgi:hypothetical protein